jgi:hypothetical protein
MLALLIPIQVHASTYTFDIASQMSITFGSVAGVSYTYANPITFSEATLGGNSGLSLGDFSESWNDGTLSINFAPTSGWATAPPNSFSEFFEQQLSEVTITNTNDHAVQIPVTSSLAWVANVTASEDGYGGGYVENFLELVVGGDGPSMYSDCVLEPPSAQRCGGSGTENYFNFAGGMPAVETLSFTLGADSDVNVRTQADEDAVVSTTPEPGSLSFLGLGMTALAGMLYRKRTPRSHRA